MPGRAPRAVRTRVSGMRRSAVIVICGRLARVAMIVRRGREQMYGREAAAVDRDGWHTDRHEAGGPVLGGAGPCDSPVPGAATGGRGEGHLLRSVIRRF